jgi:UMF1 family MFS transporter
MATIETTAATPPVVAERGAGPLAVGSWALYDFANTIYSWNIVSLYFPAFILAVGLQDWQYSVPYSLSMLLVGLISPFMGGLSDRGAGRRLPWLMATTLVCVSLVAVMGLSSNVLLIIGALILANAAYQIAGIFYDALLPAVSTRANWGKVSGIGVGLGYAGTLFSVAVMPLIVGKTPSPQATFLPTAFLFLLFSLPCFLFVRERLRPGQQSAAPVPTVAGPGPHAIVGGAADAPLVETMAPPPQPEKISFRSSLTQTWRTLQEARTHTGLWRFLVSNFLYSDALNTVIIAMGVYATKVIGFADPAKALAPAIIAAAVGAWLFGFVADWLTSKQSLIVSLVLWLIVLVLAMFVADSSPTSQFLFQWVVAVLAGIALGSTWVAARTMMIELSPPEKLGEFMGIYNLTGKFAAVVGPLIWGGVLLLLPPATYGAFGYQVAIGALGLMVLAGLIIHWWGVPNIKRTRAGMGARG